MKISAGKIIQERNISINTPETFSATYKGREINITTDHGHGKPKYNHLKRYDITVTFNGAYEVNMAKFLCMALVLKINEIKE